MRVLAGQSREISGVAVTPIGKRAVSASGDSTLKVWDLASGKELQTLVGHSAAVDAVAATPEGKRAVSASWDQTLKVWDLETGKQVAVFTADAPLRSCAVGPVEHGILAGDGSGRVHFLSLQLNEGQ